MGLDWTGSAGVNLRSFAGSDLAPWSRVRTASRAGAGERIQGVVALLALKPGSAFC